MASLPSLYFSYSFVISCGTVAIDHIKRKILLIKSRQNGEIMLPKGRKHIGETLEQAAVRETYEETGHSVYLYPVSFKHNATHCSATDAQLDTMPTMEPFAMQQRISDYRLKVIFWFIADFDSTQPRHEGTTDQPDEDFESGCYSFRDAISLLSYEQDKEICEKALQFVGLEVRERVVDTSSLTRDTD